jgi:hypothetical protein
MLACPDSMREVYTTGKKNVHILAPGLLSRHFARYRHSSFRCCSSPHTSGKADLESYADAAAKTFLRAYAPALADAQQRVTGDFPL